MSGGGSSTTTQKSYTPQEEEIRQFMLKTGQDIYDKQATSGPGQYPGAKPIPASAETEAARRQLTNFSLGQGQTIAQTTGEALQFGMKDVLNPQSNPYYQAHQEAAIRPINQAYTDPGGVIQTIGDRFTAGSSGGYGTRESIAGGIAGRGYLDTVGDVTAKMGSEAYGQGLDTFGRTMAFAPQSYNMMTQPAATLATVGGSREAEAAGQENYAAQQRQFEMNAPWMNLQNLGSVFQGTASPGSVTNADAASNPMMSAAGGAMAGWAVGAQVGGASGGPWGAAIGALAGLMFA